VRLVTPPFAAGYATPPYMPRNECELVLMIAPARRSTMRGAACRQQWNVPDRCTPTTYYYPDGPIGQLFDAIRK